MIFQSPTVIPMTVFYLTLSGTKIMKQTKFLIIIALITTSNASMAVSKLDPTNLMCFSETQGLTQTECNAQCKSGQYCCAICYLETSSETCPAGWNMTTQTNLNGTETTLCTRTDNIIVASDDTGYLKQNYGSCSPTIKTTKEYLYEISTTNKTDSGGRYYCKKCINLN